MKHKILLVLPSSEQSEQSLKIGTKKLLTLWVVVIIMEINDNLHHPSTLLVYFNINVVKEILRFHISLLCLGLMIPGGDSIFCRWPAWVSLLLSLGHYRKWVASSSRDSSLVVRQLSVSASVAALATGARAPPRRRFIALHQCGFIAEEATPAPFVPDCFIFRRTL